MAANGQVEALRKQLDQRAQSEKAIQAEAERLKSKYDEIIDQLNTNESSLQQNVELLRERLGASSTEASRVPSMAAAGPRLQPPSFLCSRRRQGSASKRPSNGMQLPTRALFNCSIPSLSDCHAVLEFSQRACA